MSLRFKATRIACSTSDPTVGLPKRLAFDNMGLANTQMIATFFDGVARHFPEGFHFKRRAEEVGFRQAVLERDGGDAIAGEKR